MVPTYRVGHARYSAPPPRRRATPRKVLTVQSVKVPAAAWSLALALADGDTARLAPQPDGSVIVTNHRRGPRPSTL